MTVPGGSAGSPRLSPPEPGALPGRPRGFLRRVCGPALLTVLLPARGAAGMINAILVFNNHGKPRLVRFYQHLVRHRYRHRHRRAAAESA